MAKKKIDKRKNNGGARPGAGPKTLPEGEKKIQITLYYKEKDVNLLGGKDTVKQILNKYFENKLKNN